MSIDLVTVKADRISSLRCGAEIKRAFFPKNYADLNEIWQQVGDDVTFFGGLTNTLVCGDVSECAVFSDGLKGVEKRGDIIVAGAGERLSKVASFAKNADLAGLEKLSGIPGTTGGAVRGNAGCYGVETADILCGVEVFRFDTGSVEYYDREEIFFSYRHAGFCGREMIVKAFFSLVDGDKNEIDKVARSLRRERRLSQPALPSLGSVFKRCDGVAAGYYIERAGLKGTRYGGMRISDVHANFIVNTGDGTPSDYLYLVKTAEKKVYETFGVRLQREVKIIGEEDGQF